MPQPAVVVPGFAPRHDLQLQPTPIIGRARELAQGRQRLLSADVRLLTVTGPPGVGKTRLALQLAGDIRDEFAAGVRFVDLAPILDPNLVIEAVALALGLRNVDRRVVIEVVEQHLRDQSILLVLDNFEHILEAVRVVGQLLAACPGLKVLVTSRASLHISWEHELPLAPLGLPASGQAPTATLIADSAAGQLFIQRAQSVAPDFIVRDADAAAVAQICARLDGLPLAIELAAARIKLLPPRALLRRLFAPEQPEPSSPSVLRLLADGGRDLPPRHSTLVRAIAWSYDLLEPSEQALFRRLAVFVGGCSIDAAEAVAAFDMSNGLEGIASLVDRNLLRTEEQDDGEPRLRMLETIAEYARAQLASSDESELVVERHAGYFLQLVEEASRQFGGALQQTWFARLVRDRANLRALERWATARGKSDILIRLWAMLWPLWHAREDDSHSRDRLQAIVPVLDQAPPGPTLVRALHGAGLMAEKLGDYATCRALLERGVALARALDERALLALVLDSLGRQEFIEGRYAESRPLLAESYAILQEIDDAKGLARVLSHSGFLEHLQGRPAAARAMFEQGLGVARAVDDRHRVAEFMDNLGNTAEVEGDLETATRMFHQAIEIWRDLDQGHWLSMALNNLGKVEVRRGELPAARNHLLEALQLAHRLGNRRRSAFILAAVSQFFAAEGQRKLAATLYATASSAVAEMGAALPRSVPNRMLEDLDSTPIMPLERAVEETLVRLAGDGHAPDKAAPVPELRGTAPLTRREREVVALLGQGLTNREIAESLVLSEGTVENYVQRILRKLGSRNRAQIAIWATENGFGPPRTA